jgi:hypothetical protein
MTTPPDTGSGLAPVRGAAAALAGQVRKIGPGLLEIGSTGSLVDLATRCSSATIKWKKNAEDSELMLSGDTVAGDVTYTAQLTAKVKQGDLTTGGLIAWSWLHKGEQLPFTYQPYGTGPAIVGDLVVDPIDAGGDVGSKPSSDITWDCIGEPGLSDDLA